MYKCCCIIYDTKSKAILQDGGDCLNVQEYCAVKEEEEEAFEKEEWAVPPKLPGLKVFKVAVSLPVRGWVEGSLSRRLVRVME